MNAVLFVDILDKTLVPFIERVYPEGHKFMQDNDPKHTSVMAREWMEEKSINWWKTPAESPDLNPIENLWHELKEYIRRVKEELIDRIQQFWETVDQAKCEKYIGHPKGDKTRKVQQQDTRHSYYFYTIVIITIFDLTVLAIIIMVYKL